MTDEYQPDLEITKPSAARMYDYALGGYHNYAIDRQAFEQVLAINPDGLDLVPPGLVWLPEWRPESVDDVLLNQPERSSALAAVGQRVRGP